MTRLLPHLSAVLAWSAVAAAADPALWTGAQPVELGLPANQRAVRSLVFAAGRMWGTTSGTSAHVFVVDGDRAAVLHSAANGTALFGLCVSADGRTLYAGSAAATEIPDKFVKRDKVGRLLRFDLAGDPPAAKAVDLGAPVAGQGIVALAMDEERGALYGLTEPDGHFFVHDLKAGVSRDLHAVAGRRPFEKEYPAQVSRALLVLADGSVITGGAEGRLFRYDPKAGRIAKTALALPAVAGREGWASIDALVRRADGRIFGGTSDGYLFSLDAGATEILNHGKPLRQGGIQGLVIGPDGKLYGVGGEVGGMPRGFRFDPARGAYDLAGIPSLALPGDAGLMMQGFGAIAIDGSGRIWAGERDRIGRLVRFPSLPGK